VLDIATGIGADEEVAGDIIDGDIAGTVVVDSRGCR
jgi:hypothetical protein